MKFMICRPEPCPLGAGSWLLNLSDEKYSTSDSENMSGFGSYLELADKWLDFQAFMLLFAG
jgi:hypothetical protein